MSDHESKPSSGRGMNTVKLHRRPAKVMWLFAIFALLLSGCATAVAQSDGDTVHFSRALSLAAKPVAQADQLSLRIQSADTAPAEQPLIVTSTQPTGGSSEVDPSTQIIVVFNRPVVPLTGIDAQADLPSPLTFEPDIPGFGQWINTSVYAYRPDEMLDGSTTYTVTVDDLTTVNGESLTEPYRFTFSTASPTVTGASPSGSLVTPESPVEVQFSQPMDASATAQAFHLVRLDGTEREDVDGQLTWDDSQRTLYFTPTNQLEFGQSYDIQVTEEAAPASGTGNLRAPFSSQFTVVPYPDIVSITPSDGAVNVSPETSVVLRFSTHISGTQAIQNINISPLISTTRVYSYYSPYLDEFTLSWNKEPHTLYTVTVGGEIEDDYGNTLGDDRIFTFQTGDYTPFVDLELERFTHFTAVDETRCQHALS